MQVCRSLVGTCARGSVQPITDVGVGRVNLSFLEAYETTVQTVFCEGGCPTDQNDILRREEVASCAPADTSNEWLKLVRPVTKGGIDSHLCLWTCSVP
ncbi:hypothetical protein EMIT051CA3_20785 [Pseudomonas chlororaphis]